jgi:7-cyano-7-deazaguanine synthase
MTTVRRVLLLSGGMDSIALAYWMRPELCVTLDYGQVPAAAEIQASESVCRELGLMHQVIRADCRAVGSGDLAGSSAVALAPVREWWPFRNQLLVTLAAAAVVDHGYQELLLGTVRTDGVHRDGCQEFLDRLSGLLEFQEGHLRVRAPAIHLDSAELIRESGVPQSVLAWAHSCHVATLACGRCRGCHKHANVVEACGHSPY